MAAMEERMDRRIAQLALDRFRVDGFVGTSIADLAGALGVSKAAIYYHYRSKDALLHRLVDPLLDAIDTCIHDHQDPGPNTARTAGRLPGRPARPPRGDSAGRHRRRRAQPPQHRPTPARPEPPASVPADRPNHRRGGQAARRGRPGAIWRPLIAQPPLDLTDPAHQHILVEAAIATLRPSPSHPTGRPAAAAHIGPHAEHS